MEKLKVVGLLSGGKDSCYNILKCQAYGHQLVCLANLMPLAPEVEEINSFMYQSAAHGVIPAVAECFGVPLIRRPILGTTKVHTMDYVRTDDDEVEDLYNLLVDVLARFPEVKGVSCGAIVSNYQRVRVEHICSRLNLVSLCYLWQRDRGELLNEIIDSETRAVLVKVAGAGLVPAKHLGQELGSLKPTLLRLHEKYGLDLCGEGGEYETLVLDCPAFRKRLEITGSTVVYDDEDVSVGNLVISGLKIIDKTTNDEEAYVFNHPCWTSPEISVTSVGPTARNVGSDEEYEAVSFNIGNDGYVTTSLLHVPHYSGFSDTDNVSEAVSHQIRFLLCRLQVSIAKQIGEMASINDTILVHLYVSDMKYFDIVNNEYCKHFSDKTPHARCCVQVCIIYLISY
jgi:diphthine-ammonia ligase